MNDDLRSMLYHLDAGKENDLRKRVTKLEMAFASLWTNRSEQGDDLPIRVIDDQGNLRYIISPYSLLDELGIAAHAAALDAKGTPQQWIDADTGKEVAGGGDVSIGDDGIVTQDSIPLEFRARNNFFGDVYSAFMFSQGSGHLNLLSNFKRGNTNLIVDGNFESGGVSNWNVTAANVSIVSDVVHGGSYALKVNPDSIPWHEIKSAARFAVTATKIYFLQIFTDQKVFSADFVVYLDYYNAFSGGTLLETHTLLNKGRDTDTWQRAVGLPSIAPAGATYASLRIQCGANSNTYIDDISLVEAGGLWIRSAGAYWESNKSINLLSGSSFLINNLPIPHGSLGDVGTNNHATIDAHLALTRWTTKTKEANETRNSNTTIAADSDIVITIQANGKYVIRGKIFFFCAATPDFKYRFQIGGTPTLLSINVRENYLQTDVRAPAIYSYDTSPTTTISITSASANQGVLDFEILIHKENATHNLIFAWAQNTSNAGNTTVLEGSYIEYVRTE